MPGCCNSSKTSSKALDVGLSTWWKLDYTRPGKPTDNGVIRSFNGCLSDELLNVREFVTMHDAPEKLQALQEDYNPCRPYGSRQPDPM